MEPKEQRPEGEEAAEEATQPPEAPPAAEVDEPTPATQPPAAAAPLPPAKPRLEPLPAGYWFGIIAMILSLAALAGTAGRTWYGMQLKALEAKVAAAEGESARAKATSGVDLGDAGLSKERLPGGLFATFYRGTNFERPVKSSYLQNQLSYRTEFEWGAYQTTNASVRLGGYLKVPAAGSYEFYLDVNDRAKVWINNQLLVDMTDAINKPAGKMTLPAGWVPICIEWSNATGNGWLGLKWAAPGVGGFLQPAVLSPDPGVVPPR